MTIIRRLLLLGVIFFSVSFFACQQPQQQTNTKLNVLTTIAPLYSFTKNITGDIAVVDNLLPSGAGPHEYSFAPDDIKKITKAQVLIKNGVNLESWLDKLIKSTLELRINPEKSVQQATPGNTRKLMVIDSSIGVDIINNDPHIWLSPRNAIIQVRNITSSLAKIDPGNSGAYKENAEAYINRLNILDKEIQEEVATWVKKEFVAFHPAFSYFAKDYGLKQIAVIQESPEKKPTPGHIANVINKIKNAGIKAIFSEPQVSSKIVKAIAGDLNLQVYSLDTMETGELYPVRKKASPELSNWVYLEWYEDRMRANLAVLKKALN